MNRRIKLVAAFCVVLAARSLTLQAQGPVPAGDATVKGKLDAVTVYRGQALVTRLVDIPGGVGLREVVVGDLPERIVPSSLYAESAEGVEIRSVLYRERPVDKDVRADVRKLDEQIRTTQDQINANQRSAQVIGEERAYLSKLETFIAPTANTELTKGVLNAETLKTLTGFVFDTRKSLSDQELKLGTDARNLQEALNTLQRQRDQIAQQSARTLREAVVFVNAKAANAKMRVRYMVDQATWDPSYNIRADGKGGVVVEYNASIQQMSGEDWGDVAMTLSTATPNLVAKAPKLEPLAIALTNAPVNAPALSYSEVRRGFAVQKQQLEVLRNSGNGTFNFNGGNMAQPNAPGAMGGGGAGGGAVAQAAAAPQMDAEKGLNELAGQQQVAELLARDSKKDEVTWTRRSDEVISVTYDLAARTSLPSRSDRQLIQVAAVPVKGEFYKVAVPVLTNYVYDQATLTNQSNMVLLAGPVSSYMAGQFMGSGDIPTVAVGETFSVGFGIDASLRATRERTEKTENVQGGNRLLEYTYRLGVENFSANPVEVRLMDRLPTGKDTVKDSEVRVTMENPAIALSTDAEYQRTSRKDGILRWDVKVPAKATGDQTYWLDYKFKVEYDRQMSITGMPATDLRR